MRNLHVHLQGYVRTKLFYEKSTCLSTFCKKIIFKDKNKYLLRDIFYLFIPTIEISVFCESLRTHIDY
jgi:hypothetical protein